MIGGIAFDFDGTLYDAAEMVPQLDRLAVGLLSKSGVLSPGEARGALACRREEEGRDFSYSGFLSEQGVELDAWHRALVESVSLDSIRPDPGICEAVRAASARVSVAVLTNSPERFVKRVLRRLGMEDGVCFSGIVTPEVDGRPKPARDLFERVCEVLERRSEACLMVGDRYVVDIAPALGIGMAGVLLDGPAEVVRALATLASLGFDLRKNR